jgi:hypothetical protein
MPRDRNTIATKKLHLSTTPQVVAVLDALVRTGLFGKTRTEVAEEILRVKVRDAVTDGWLERSAGAPPKPHTRKRRG